MIEFSNNYVYTLDPEGDVTGLTWERLPKSWQNPSGVSYSNFDTKSTSELNSLGWYKVYTNKPTKTDYEKYTLSTVTFNNNEFLATFTKSYKTLEEVRTLKKNSLHNEMVINIQTTLDDRTEPENFQVIFKSLGLLIHSFSETNPQTYVNNNSYLQAVLTQADQLETETQSYKTRINQVDTETDILTIINL